MESIRGLRWRETTWANPSAITLNIKPNTCQDIKAARRPRAARSGAYSVDRLAGGALVATARFLCRGLLAAGRRGRPFVGAGFALTKAVPRTPLRYQPRDHRHPDKNGRDAPAVEFGLDGVANGRPSLPWKLERTRHGPTAQETCCSYHRSCRAPADVGADGVRPWAGQALPLRHAPGAPPAQRPGSHATAVTVATRAPGKARVGHSTTCQPEIHSAKALGNRRIW